MISIKFDNKTLNKALKNSVGYSHGFLQGAELEQITFNKKLGDLTVETLYKYIDTKARMSPESLHHVYEWGEVGSPGARLFQIESVATKRTIRFFGNFLQSSSVSPTSTEPFYDKANIMENSIDITVEPKSSNVLVFEDNGETVFTTNSIYIASPGGPAVEGSFGRAVDAFFNNYFTTGFLISSGIYNQLSTAREYSDYFPQGVKSGRVVGVRAGKRYMDIPTGVEVE